MSLTVATRPTAEVEPPWSLKDLPPYGPVARKLMKLTADENVALSKVQDVLRTDAVFTADVLRLANSPLIGLRTPVASVIRAVTIIGLDRIKALATTLALRSFLTAAEPNDALQACWRHNLATALVCERLARLTQIDADKCYTAGLLHDIGRMALLRTCRDRYDPIFSLDETDGSVGQLQMEKSIFGIDHCEAGRRILEHWDFPEELCEVVSNHHIPPEPGATGLIPVVYAGGQIADMLGFSVINRPAEIDLAMIVAFLPADATARLVGQFPRLAEEVAFKVNAIECSLL